MSEVAFARHRRHHYRHYRHHIRYHHHVRHYRPYDPPFADIVMDAKTGRVLSGTNIDAPRHPASLTKVMTLYLLFEQMAKGKITTRTRMEVSRHAASQEPTKLGARAGTKVSVEAIIKSIVTQSANDMAVVIAENLGGTESHFAEMMNAKARQLGMMHTHYADASGLPNPAQITTARDVAILGRAIQESFPQYYHYFSTRHYVWHGFHMHNHNHMLNYVKGMDGIKTGFTTASGFNLLTSVRRHGRHIISVVLGGKSWRGRDKIMAGLINANLDRASKVRTVALIRDPSLGGGRVVAENDRPHPLPMATRSEPAPQPAPHRDLASTHLVVAAVDPHIARLPVHKVRPVYFTVKPTPATRLPVDDRAVATIPVVSHNGETPRQDARQRDTAVPAALGWKVGPQGHAVDARQDGAAPQRAVAAAPQLAHPQIAAKGTDWMIQIGATGTADQAAALLERARSHDRQVLSQARTMTIKVGSGHGSFYRARFAGLQMASAQAACRNLKRSGFACFATRN
ncbi:MAG: D-alanyl-D-alanine carboxypeptidase [Hyphomicrobiales bacterium]|nr:D-alanyl-D-alanine carboxypeptidase [Hyphomicrobiales bacterium]